MPYVLIADMTAALHNYITVEPQKFLANPKHLEMIYNMCKTVSVHRMCDNSGKYIIKVHW